MCAGDTTIEWPVLEYDATGQLLRGSLEGYDITHQCRDWSQIVDFAVERRSSDRNGSLAV